MKTIPFLCQIGLLCIASHGFAENSRHQPMNYTAVEEKALIEDNLRRNQWSLSPEDWSRYKTLMQGIRGSISPENISPIEVLGTHARNERERRKYAEQWARMRHDDVTRILAFQKAYDSAYAKLYPNEQMINTRLLNLQHTKQFKPGDRILVFLKINACPACEQLIQKLRLDGEVKSLPVDIYFIDTDSQKEDGKIRQWAAKQQLDKHRLKNGSLTLNHDNGNLYRITKKLINPVPLVFRVNAKTLKQIAY